MTVVYGVAVGGGLALLAWAHWALGAEVSRWPVPMTARCQRGPYRLVRHPMYVGTLLLVMGLAGLAAGAWNVLAVGTVTELLLREWAWRETGEGW